MLEYISNYSLYACEQEMRAGIYHDRRRTQSGIVGTGYYGKWEGKEPEIHSSVNIRVAHEMIGCADAVFPYIVCNRLLCHTFDRVARRDVVRRHC